ncbi:MAG: carboxypeptidase M32, partial [Phycisphaerae bacterium]
MERPYERLLGKIRECGQLASIEALLDWDQETCMPPNGLAGRAEQLSLVARLLHERKASPEIGELLSKLDGDLSDPAENTNVRETRRIFERAGKVPAELVGRIARIAAHAKAAWAKAKADSNFDDFAPHLQQLLELKQEVADRIGFPNERYDALLDEFEPGARTDEVADIFNALRQPLADFAQQLGESKAKPDVSILHRRFPQPAQEKLARKLAAAIGFDFNSGRIDVSNHPFCSGTAPHDIRLTTRYREDFFPTAIFGTLHEAGHG